MSPTPNSPPLRVVLGTHVEVELIDDLGSAEPLAIDIVSDQEADFAHGFVGLGTPLAQALMGQPAGAVVPYVMADIRSVRILDVSPSQRAPNPDAAAQRDAAARDAVNKANLEDAVRLALTVDVKWGDYDPEGLAEHWE